MVRQENDDEDDDEDDDDDEVLEGRLHIGLESQSMCLSSWRFGFGDLGIETNLPYNPFFSITWP